MEEQTKLITLENLQQYHTLSLQETQNSITESEEAQKVYVDSSIEAAKEWAQEEDNDILSQAKEYADNSVNSLNIKGGEGEGSIQQTTGNASGANSSALGHSTIASGSASHAEGEGALATGNYTHAEGYQTQAVGTGSHAEGGSTYAQGEYSHAEGYEVIANGNYEHAQGKYNVIQSGDSVNRYADVVGNGTDANNRSNAYTLDWEGNAWFAGDIKTGGTSYDDAESLIKASDITFDRASEKASILRFKVSGEIVGEIPAPEVQFNGATTFVSKEIKSYYTELGLVPETVNGFAFGSSGDISGGDINYFTEENGPYMVLTNRDIINPTTLYGGNVIILKDILPSEEPSLELLTIQLDGSTVGTYNGSAETTINIEAASKEYVQELVSSLTGASFEVVDELPIEGIKSNTIYLVPAQGSGIDNIYNEYIYVSEQWELIGSTAIDLTNYATKDYVDEQAVQTYMVNLGDLSQATKDITDEESLTAIKNYFETVLSGGKANLVAKQEVTSSISFTLEPIAVREMVNTVDGTTVYGRQFLFATIENFGTIQPEDSSTADAILINMALSYAPTEDTVLAYYILDTLMAPYLATNKNYSTPYVPLYDGSPATKKYVDDAIANIPSSENTVSLDGAQTITGVKTFEALPESSVAPTTDNQFANKAYVDNSIPFKVLPQLNNGNYWELADIGIGYFYSDRIDLRIYSAAGSSAVDYYYNAYLFITEVGRYRYITIRYSDSFGDPMVAYGSSDSQRDWLGEWITPLTVISGNNVLTLNRAQSISGLKTFATLPVSSVVPTTNNQLVNKAYVDGLVSTISTLSFQVVTELPTTDIQTNVIYLVPSTTSSEQNIYDEYIYINNAWEKIGSTAIDTSNYLAKDNTSAYTPTGDYNPATKKYVDDLFGQYTAQIMARLETLTNPSNYDEELSKLTGGGAEI